MKTFDPDDPMLTAYALGELEGDELREIEELIARDPVAARHVESIRAAAAGFGEAFEREPAPQVEPIRAVEIEPKRRTPFVPWLFYASTAAAACFFIVLVVRLADPAAQEKESNLAAEVALPAAPAEPVDEVAGASLRQQPAPLGKEQAVVSDMAAADRTESESQARKKEMAEESTRERDDAIAAKSAASAPPPALGEMKDASKFAGSRTRANEGEMRSLDSFEASAGKGDGDAVLEGFVAKLDADTLPASIDTVALLAELGLKEPESNPSGELGNVAGQMAASASPMPDPEAALVRAVEGFARLVSARTRADDESWERVLADARYAAGSDPKRLEFVALVGRTRDAIAATAH